MHNLGKNFGMVILILVVAFLFVFFGTDVSGKTVSAACNLNYTDISSGIAQMLSNAHPFPPNHRFYEPKVLSERYLLFMTSDYPSIGPINIYDYYLYDLGIDGLLLTNDDRAIYITNNTQAHAPTSGPSAGVIPELHGMVDESGGLTRFYWTFYDYQNGTPLGSRVYSCTLNQNNCIQHTTVLSIQNINHEIMDIVPINSQNRIYLVIADDTQWSFLNGHIASCSILPLNSTPLPSDHCSNSYGSFTNHTNYSTYSGIIKEKGIIYHSFNVTSSNSFFDVISQNSISVPQNTMSRSNVVTLLNNLFYTYRNYPSNANFTDFFLIKPATGRGTILKTDRNRITPLLVENDMSDLLYVYSRTRPGFYGQYITRFDGVNWSNSQIYSANNHVGAPWPITVTNDGRIFATRGIGVVPGLRFYQSTCSG